MFLLVYETFSCFYERNLLVRAQSYESYEGTTYSKVTVVKNSNFIC